MMIVTFNKYIFFLLLNYLVYDDSCLKTLLIIMKQDHVYVPIMFWLKFKEELSDVWKLIDNYRNVQEVNVVKTKIETLILQNGWGQVTVNNEVNEDKEVYFRYLGESFFHVTFFKIDEENAANKLPLKPKK